MPMPSVAAQSTRAKNTAAGSTSVPSASVTMLVASIAATPNSASNAPDTIVNSRSIVSPPAGLKYYCELSTFVQVWSGAKASILAATFVVFGPRSF